MNVELNLTAREDVPLWLVYGTPVFTVAAALAVGALALSIVGVDPMAAYSVLFIDTLTTRVGTTETLVKTVPLVLTGLAVYLPLKAGLFNIGAEGQLLAGALAGTWLGLNVSWPLLARVPAMLVVSAIAGGLWAWIPAWLRARWNVNEIITSLLLTFVAIDIQNYLLRGPMQSDQGNFPQTELFSQAATIPDVYNGVHAGILIAVVFAVMTHLLMTKTRLGFAITFVGSNDEAARQAGISKYRAYVLVFLIGGVFAGVAGISEIAGAQGRFRAAYAPGYGFTAIPIALLGRNSALKVVLAAVFFAVLFVGGAGMEVRLSVPFAITEIIQALVILFLITAEFFKRYRIDIDIDRSPAPTTTPRRGDD